MYRLYNYKFLLNYDLEKTKQNKNKTKKANNTNRYSFLKIILDMNVKA